MKNTSLPKLIKWVLSGAIHPIVLFNKDLMRETAVDDLGPEYASKSFPWAFDESTTGEIFNWVCEELSTHYTSSDHLRRDITRISERIFKIEDLECPNCQADILPGMTSCPGCRADIDDSLPPGTIVETTVVETTSYLNDPYDPFSPGIDLPI